MNYPQHELRDRLEGAYDGIRHALLRELYANWPAAAEASKIFHVEDEARWLVEAHRRLSFTDRAQIHEAAEPVHNPEEFGVPCAYSDLVGAEFAYLTLVESDIWFAGPVTNEEQQRAFQLLGRIHQLDRRGSNALFVLMESAYFVHVGTISYARWWTPEILTRLLQNPELDRLRNHR